jgi:transcription-repair coupling factor (superfamily II helicase)
MSILTSAVRQDKEYTELRNSALLDFKIPKPLPIAVGGLCDGASDAVLVSLIEDIRQERGGTALVICQSDKECARTAELLRRFGIAASVFGTRDLNLYNITASHDYEHERLRVLFGITHGTLDAVVTTPDAALGYTVPKERLQKSCFRLDFDTPVDLSSYARRLSEAGYVRVDMVDGMGQFAIRGGILDVFPPVFEAIGEDVDNVKPTPFRIELFGDEIDRVGPFDIESQRFLQNLDGLMFPPAHETLADRDILLSVRDAVLTQQKRAKDASAARELEKELTAIDLCLHNDDYDLSFIDKYISLVYPERACLLDYFGERPFVILRSHAAVGERLKVFEQTLAQTVTDLLTSGTISPKLAEYACPIGKFHTFCSSSVAVRLDSLMASASGERLGGLFTFRTKHHVSYNEKYDLLYEDITNSIRSGYKTIVIAENETSAKNLGGLLKEKGYKTSVEGDGKDYTAEDLPVGTVYITWRAFLSGYELASSRISIFSLCPDGKSNASAASNRLKTAKRKKSGTQAILSAADLEEGDYVVHENYGIGIYEGIQKLTVDGVSHDYINIRFAGSDKLFLPVEKMDMVSKYIGARSEDGVVRLSKFGGAEWGKTKAKTKAAVKDIAKDLIKLYAERMRREGFAFPPDDDMQADFESSFEFDETSAQLDAIADIKEDMEKATPMDRLLCGDVGYGKTEVALRAAYKAVLGGKQVALLVPTTILALQHYGTAVSRMRAFGVEVDMISRFRTPKQIAQSVRKLARGETDLIIGTHRLLSGDISFKDLGLLIIDEEQRFGVAQKEKIKQIAGNVDVLTLTATPIPRTLNMAMGGIRDISVLDEAPCDRLPVQTYVLEDDDTIIFEAIRRELRRGGQVFYMHNVIESINTLARRISEQFPDASIRVAHGKMEKEELEDIWNSMLTGETDILISTSIIETGIDVPNANTLIVDNAHRLGLSQLHQLRGRVGRSSRRAYAYFTYPKNMALTEISEKRLEAIRDYAEFGAGFKIAMRDLELRGAGDLLGARQHGHLDAVGYDMYIKLLNEAILEEKGVETKAPAECKISLALDAFLPESYVKFASRRMQLYKRIAMIRNRDDYYDIADELIDRFGEMPKPTKNLLSIALLRGIGIEADIHAIEQEGNIIHIYPNHFDIEVWSELSEQFKCLKATLSSKVSIDLNLKTADPKLAKDPPELLYKIFENYLKIAAEIAAQE